MTLVLIRNTFPVTQKELQASTIALVVACIYLSLSLALLLSQSRKGVNLQTHTAHIPQIHVCFVVAGLFDISSICSIISLHSQALIKHFTMHNINSCRFSASTIFCFFFFFCLLLLITAAIPHNMYCFPWIFFSFFFSLLRAAFYVLMMFI